MHSELEVAIIPWGNYWRVDVTSYTIPVPNRTSTRHDTRAAAYEHAINQLRIAQSLQVDKEDEGAAGDGVTDDAPAIQRALPTVRRLGRSSTAPDASTDAECP